MSEAPARIWAVTYPHHSGKGPPIINASASETNGREYIRADHAQAEKETAVAAEREACASRLESLKDTAYQNNLLAEGVTYSCAIKAIRARANTDALAARDAQVRAEALREAAVNLKTYAPHLEDGPEHDVGFYYGYYTAFDRILALIPADQEENLND